MAFWYHYFECCIHRSELYFRYIQFVEFTVSHSHSSNLKFIVFYVARLCHIESSFNTQYLLTRNKNKNNNDKKDKLFIIYFIPWYICSLHSFLFHFYLYGPFENMLFIICIIISQSIYFLLFAFFSVFFFSSSSSTATRNLSSIYRTVNE